MKKLIISLISLIALAQADKVGKCVEYSSDKFILKSYISVNDKFKKIHEKLQSIKFYYFFKNGKASKMTIGYKINGHEFFNADGYCDGEADSGFRCGIECDGGSVEIDKNYAIKTDYLALYRDEADATDGIEKEIKLKDTKHFLHGKAFKCPKSVPTYNNIDEKEYKDNPKGKYVCYDYKIDGKYDGCFRAVKSCRTLHRQHFGKYLTPKDSKKALLRCKRSKPNKNYIDNKKGLYVCYDYKNRFGKYSGCFRSLKSCKSIHKEHFGKYPNFIESRNALIRCNGSSPRK